VKIKVKGIPQEGLELSEAIDALEIGFGADELKLVSPLKVEGEVYKKRDLVVADLAVEGQYEFLCARCLEPVTVSRKDQFAVHIDIDPSVEFVDLGEEIRQELLLNISTIVLCQNDCKGLCPSCGVNLNNEKCQCKE
jgi:uncharacterized metal-binding protein YceD (DUF177 family)